MFSDPCLMGWHWPLHLLIYCEEAINTFKFRTGAVISCKEFFYEKHKVAFVLHWRNRTRTSAVMRNVHACVCVSVHLQMYHVRSINRWLKCLRSSGGCLRHRNACWRFNSKDRVKQKLISQKRKNVKLQSFRFIILCFRCAIDLWSMRVCE